MDSNPRDVRRETHELRTNQVEQDRVKLFVEHELIRSCQSVGDIVDSGKVAYLRSVANGLVQDDELFASKSIIHGSSVMKSLHTFPRQSASLLDSTNLTDTAGKEAKLVKAMELIKEAKIILDSCRLYFEAGIIFDELGMRDRAISCFTKATHRVSAEVVVDGYDLPDTPEYRRKIERMSKFHLKGFLQQRSELRNNFIHAENERQRLRAIVANCQNVRLHLLSRQFEAAHSCLRAAFAGCDSASEHSDILAYAHSILKDFSVSFNHIIFYFCASFDARPLPLSRLLATGC